MMRRVWSKGTFAAFVILVTAVAIGPVSADDGRPDVRGQSPLLVILREARPGAGTGGGAGDLPLLRADSSSAADSVVDILSRGFSGRVLRLYGAVQIASGASPDTVKPAYLFLSGNQGGFPRYGFRLAAGSEIRTEAATPYVDLDEPSVMREPAGFFGATDQIFPHEMGHILLHLLLGEKPEGGASVVHALGVQTDRATAFDEGFAEAIQVLAIDDPDADPRTRALSEQPGSAEPPRLREARANLREYRRELIAFFAPAPLKRLTFLAWWSPTEQALRYYGVKENSFAYAPAVPGRLLRGRSPYKAWLLENMLPGGPPDPPKAPARLVATEGVMAALFSRWLSDPSIGGAFLEPGFYAAFGIAADSIGPVENACLKLFAALRTVRQGASASAAAAGEPAAPRTYDIAALVAVYKAQFPRDAAALDRIVNEVFLGEPFPKGPELWVERSKFRIGSSLYDQFRGVPIPRVFDLNAAGAADLAGIRGVGRSLARSIREGAPYDSVGDLSRVPGMTGPVLAKFREMRSAAQEPRKNSAALEEFSLGAIARPYLMRAAYCILAAWIAGALLYKRVGRSGWAAAIAAGFGASVIGLVSTWFPAIASGIPSAPAGVFAIAVPVILLGTPGVLYKALRRRGGKAIATGVLAWAAAALPAAILTRPWF